MFSSKFKLNYSKFSFNLCFKNIRYISYKSFNNFSDFKTDSMYNKLEVKTKFKIFKNFLSTQELIAKLKSNNIQKSILQSNNSRKLIFIDNENQFAFKIIDSLLSERMSELNQNKPNTENNSEINSNKIFNDFFNINPQEFRRYVSLIMDLIKISKTLSLEQISKMIESMAKWPVLNEPFDPLFYKLWSNLDQELENRLKIMNFKNNNEVNEYLLIGNEFYKLRIANITKFNQLLVKKLSSPDFELNKISFLHLLFYINLHRNVDKKSVDFLLKSFDNLKQLMNLNEIGIFSMALFKTEIKLTEDLTKFIIFKTISDISIETNNIIRAAITKCIRKSFHFKIEPQFRQYIEKLQQLTNNSELTLTHLLILSMNANIFDEKLMKQMFDKLYENPLTFRIKDIERIFLCFSFFSYQLDNEKVESICHILDKNSEFFQIYLYPICLLNIVQYLCILGFYPKTLIKNCFEPNFLAKITSNQSINCLLD